MTEIKTSVFAVFVDEPDLEYAVAKLKLAGFRNTDISCLISPAMTPERGIPDRTPLFTHERSTKAPEGSTAGAATGALVGGALGWLAGLGTLVLPGLGPLIAAGPIMAALAGAGLCGAVGGVAGALIGLGIPEYEAKRYEGQVKEGKVLLAVLCEDLSAAKKAAEILEKSGGHDVAAANEAGATIKHRRPRARLRDVEVHA